MKTPVYLDNHSTTPLDPRVLEAMMPFLTDHFGNAASRSHAYGWTAEEAVSKARQTIADGIGANDSKEIVFTSGATESDNIALKGVTEMYARKGNHIITCSTEHKAILDTCKRLERSGKVEVTYLETDAHGRVSPEQVSEAITDKTLLVSLMAANNEIGTLHPLAEIGAVCHERGVLFHCDAAQALGRMPIDVSAMNIDLASFSAHKLYGPKGIGVLYVRRRSPRVRVSAVIDGGGHERGIRSGTLNVPAIVGFGKAVELAMEDFEASVERTRKLRDRLHQGLLARLPEVYLNGHPEYRLPGNLNVSFYGAEGEGVMMGMPSLAVSSGSACTSASLEPSYVLRALGISDELAHNSIRFGLGRFSTEEEVDFAIDRVTEAVSGAREISPLWLHRKREVEAAGQVVEPGSQVMLSSDSAVDATGATVGGAN